MNGLAFGKFLREKRLGKKLTLREFCRRFGYDTAYISRLENNKLNPPSGEKLEALAQALGMDEGSEDWVRFFDLAHQAKNELPEDITKTAPEILNMIPAFLRTTDGQRVSKKQLDRLIEFLQGREDVKED